MNMLEAILGAQGGGAVGQIGRSVGLEQDQTVAALSALMPALAAGFQRNLQGSGGIDALTAALAGGSHGRYLDNPSVFGDQASIADGNGILSHVFGSKDVSRQVAAHAAQQTGLSSDVLKRMLPIRSGADDGLHGASETRFGVRRDCPGGARLHVDARSAARLGPRGIDVRHCRNARGSPRRHGVCFAFTGVARARRAHEQWNQRRRAHGITRQVQPRHSDREESENGRIGG